MALIITLADAKAYLGIQETSEHDALLQTYVDAVAGAAEDYCGRKFTYGSYVERRNGQARRAIRVNNPPIDTAIMPTVRENGTVLVVALGYSTTADVLVDGPGGFLYRQPGSTVVAGRADHVPGLWAPGVQNVQVDYQGGFGGVGQSPAMPESVKLFCKYAVAHFWKHAERREIGFSQRADGQRSVTFLEDLPKHYWRLLDAWRLWPAAEA